jgi:taurine dioxygenase
MQTALRFEKATSTIGAFVTGLDCSDAAALSEHASVLRAALTEHGVLFVRDQTLTPAAQVRFAQCFGTVAAVASTFVTHADDDRVELLESQGSGPGTDVWHADLTWLREPPVATCLYAVDVPPFGGDTMWASMTAAFAALDAAMQDRLRKLDALHSWECPEVIASVLGGKDGAARYKRMREDHPPLRRPVVGTHPVTSREFIDVNALYTMTLCDVTRDENNALLPFLIGLANVPERQVRLHWTPGTLVIWDNRATQHYAVNDYAGSHRLMHRITVR